MLLIDLDRRVRGCGVCRWRQIEAKPGPFEEWPATRVSQRLDRELDFLGRPARLRDFESDEGLG